MRGCGMTTPFDLFLSKLEGARAVPGGEGAIRRARAFCPCHQHAPHKPGRSPSLSIGETPAGAVLVHCFAGCEQLAVASALGLDLADLFPINSRQHVARGVGMGWLPVAALADEAYMLCMTLAERSEVHAEAAGEFARLATAFRRQARAAMRGEGRVRA